MVYYSETAQPRYATFVIRESARSRPASCRNVRVNLALTVKLDNVAVVAASIDTQSSAAAVPELAAEARVRETRRCSWRRAGAPFGYRVDGRVERVLTDEANDAPRLLTLPSLGASRADDPGNLAAGRRTVSANGLLE